MYPFYRIKRISFLLLSLIIINGLMSGCSSEKNVRKSTTLPSAQPVSVGGNQIKYEIQTGDNIKVNVWNHTNFNINQTVANDGTITYPLLGNIKVVGLNKSEFRNVLKQKLGNYIKGNINVTIDISRPNDKIVSILGSVNKPANYKIDKTTSILRVLSNAGGPKATADLEHVQIIRPGRTPGRLNINIENYFEINSKGSIQTPPYQVQPGDIIYIPPKDNIVRDLSGFMRDAVILFGVFRVLH